MKNVKEEVKQTQQKKAAPRTRAEYLKYVELWNRHNAPSSLNLVHTGR